MRITRLHNPMTSNITDYPVAEAEIGNDGNLIKLPEGGHKVTGRTLTWTLLSGETKDFPFYVADILMSVYEQKDPFSKNRGLERVEEDVKTESGDTEIKEESAKPKDGGSVCKYCGKKVKNMRGLGLHIAQKHPNELTK